MKKKVAIFDIDGTIFRSSLLIEVVNTLIENKLFPQKVRFIYAKSYQNWLDRKGSYQTYITDVIKTFEQYLKTLNHKDFLRISKQVIASNKYKTYVYIRELVDKLKKKGYFLLAISHSPKELLDEFCVNYGFDKVYGRIYEVEKNGKFTGKTLYQEEISDKEKILKRFIEKESLSLADSYGAGDSESDIKFLTFVEHPICFNPNKKLYDHAISKKWQIVVERKDVIYHMPFK